MFAIATPLVPLLLLIACGCVEVFSRGLGDFVAVDCCGLLQDQGKLEPLVAPPINPMQLAVLERKSFSSHTVTLEEFKQRRLCKLQLEFRISNDRSPILQASALG